MVEGSTYCNDVMEKHFHKKLKMTKKDGKTLKTLLNVGFMIMLMFLMMLK